MSPPERERGAGPPEVGARQPLGGPARPVRPARPAFTRGSWLARLLVALLLLPLRLLGRRGLARVARLAGWVAWVLRLRRAVVLDNLARALPERTTEERTAIARGAYASAALTALEAAAGVGARLGPGELDTLIRVDDWRGLDVLLEARKPVLVATAHFGAWELLAAAMARRGYAVSAVVRPLSGAFNEWIVRTRAEVGLEVILQRGAVRGMLAALRRGRAVVQLVDQSVPADAGVFVPFFGRLACTSPALSIVALRSGAPVYVATAAREGAGLRLVVDGPFPVPRSGDRRGDLEAHVATVVAALEAAIRRAPEQWLWHHRRWKVRPPSAGPPSSSGGPRASA